MIVVVDASVAIELIARGPAWRTAADRVLHENEELHAPHLVDLEVVSALRRAVAASTMTARAAGEALAILADLGIVRHAHDLLVPRIWALRDNLTPYDAAYVALAEALGAPLVTLDAHLAAAPGNTATIELLPH